MKAAFSASIVATAAYAARCATAPISTKSLTRCPNLPATTTLMNTTSKVSKFTWTVDVQTVLDEDTGAQWMQFHHKLIANIRSTDDVTFELSF